MTRNGSGRGYVFVSTDTWRSLIASSRALWARGLLRLISSARAMFANRGPGEKARASSTSLLFPRRTVSTLERSRERSARASWESIRILSPKRFRTFRVFFGMEFEWVSGHHRNRGKDEEKAGPPRAAARGDGRGAPVSRRLSGRL